MIILLAVIGCVSLAVGFLLPSISHRIRDKHTHGPWIIVGRHYTPPDTTLSLHARGYDLTAFADLMYGYTMLTERCGDPGCRLIRTRQLRGQVTENVTASL